MSDTNYSDFVDTAVLLVEALAKIRTLERQIARLRLTDEERYAVMAGLRSLGRALYADPENLGGEYRDMQRDAATLRGLLERHFPVPENSDQQETTPEPHSNQSEVSVRPECATSPPWLARPYWVDPPSGHRYGFPRLYDPATDGDMTAWLVAHGYPQNLADQHLPCTFTACADSQ